MTVEVIRFRMVFMKNKTLHSAAYFVPAGKNPEDMFAWKKVDCEIRNRAGDIFFAMKKVEAPEGFGATISAPSGQCRGRQCAQAKRLFC
jgi:hypothetical protein